VESHNHSPSQNPQSQIKGVVNHINRKPPFLSFVVVFIFVFISLMQIINGLCAVRQSEPSQGFAFFSYLILFSLIGYWLNKDNQRYKIAWVFDMGFFLYLAWPLIVPFYLFKTRGVKALRIIFGFIGIFLGAYIIGWLLGHYLLP
jgi:hypothetical protein